jgi:hypothetical protein
VTKERSKGVTLPGTKINQVTQPESLIATASLYELNDEDIIVSSIQSEDRTVLSDDMLLQAVLPGLQEGGIVEELTITSERAPFFKSGTLKVYCSIRICSDSLPVVEIEAPQDLPLNVGILGPEIPIQQSVEEWQTILEDRNTQTEARRCF